MALTRPLLAALAFTSFVTGMGAFITVGTVEPLADGLGITNAQSGTLLSYYAFAYALSSPILVALTGQVARRLVLALGLTLFTVASAMGALAPDFSILAVSRALAGIGAGVVTPVSAAIVALLAPPEKRARMLAVVFMGVTLAQVIGVPAGSWLAYTYGWRVALGMVAVLSLPALALVIAFVPRGLPFQATNLRDLGHVLRNPTMMLATLFTASFIAAIFLLYGHLAPLLSTALGFGRDAITLTLFVFGLGAVIGNIVGGILTDRFGAARVLSWVAALQVPCLAVFSVLPASAGFAILWTLIWSSIGWTFGAAQQVRLVGLFGAKAQVALALHAAFIFGGSALGSAVGAGVITLGGYGALGIGAALLMAWAFVHLQLSRRIGVRAAPSAP